MKQQLLAKQKQSLLVANTPEYWDDRFEKDFPLCPTAIRKGMSRRRYRKGCRKFGRHVFEHYRKLRLENMTPGDFWIIGAGNLDDTKAVIAYARSLGFRVFVADWSIVVVNKVREFFRDTLGDPSAKQNVYHADLIQALTELVNYAETRVIHLSRILDHVTPEQREEAARILIERRSSLEHLYVTIINHDTDDNLHWLGRWTSVYPFNNQEFLDRLSELNGSEIFRATESDTWEVFTEVFRATTAYLPPYGAVRPEGE